MASWQILGFRAAVKASRVSARLLADRRAGSGFSARPARKKAAIFLARRPTGVKKSEQGNYLPPMQCREAGGPLSNPPSFEWNKMRLFKRKGKRYEVVIPCQPYSTIVIGTDDAKFGGIAYTPGG